MNPLIALAWLTIVIIALAVAAHLFREAYWWLRFNFYWRVRFWWLGVGLRRMERNGTIEFVNLKLTRKIPESLTFKEWKKQQKPL